MKYILTVLLLLPFLTGWTQAGNNQQQYSSALKPSNKFIAPLQASKGMATQQAEFWRLYANSNPANAEGWFHYYTWISRDISVSASDKKNIHNNILKNAGEFVQNHSLYQLMLFLESDRKDSLALFQAIETGENQEIVYPYLLQYRLMHPQPGELKKIATKIETLNPLSLPLKIYHTNVLLSADSNAKVYAKGINDLTPLIILQEVYNIRKDIRLAFYVTGTKIEAGEYCCLSMGKEIVSALPGGQYSGLLVKVKNNEREVDLEKIIMQQFNLDPQQFNTTDEAAILLQKNYLPGFIVLYRHYKKAGSDKQYHLKAMIDKIAANTGITDVIGE